MDKLQWGNRKRLRCVKVKDSPLNGKSDGGSSGGGGVVKKKITSRVVDNNITNNVNNCSKDGNALPPVPSPHRSTRYLIYKLRGKIKSFDFFFFLLCEFGMNLAEGNKI